MRNFFTLIIALTLLPVSCSQRTSVKPKAVATKESLLPSVEDTLELVSAGSSLPSKTVNIDGINFTLVKQNEDTIYLSTTSNQFLTPEGYGVGMRFRQLNQNLKKRLQKEPGWGYYAKLNSGWNIAFCVGNSCTDHYPVDTSTIDWIFKRK